MLCGVSKPVLVLARSPPSATSLSTKNTSKMTAEKTLDLPTTVTFDAKELAAGVPSDDHVGEAVRAFHKDGLVVLDGIVSKEHLDALNKQMCAETEDLINRKTTHFK